MSGVRLVGILVMLVINVSLMWLLVIRGPCSFSTTEMNVDKYIRQKSIICLIMEVGRRGSPELACRGSHHLVEPTHGACFIINITLLSPALAWPSIA